MYAYAHAYAYVCMYKCYECGLCVINVLCVCVMCVCVFFHEYCMYVCVCVMVLMSVCLKWYICICLCNTKFSNFLSVEEMEGIRPNDFDQDPKIVKKEDLQYNPLVQNYW